MKSLLIAFFSLSLACNAFALTVGCNFTTNAELESLEKNFNVSVTIHSPILIDGTTNYKQTADYYLWMKEKSDNPRRVKGAYKLSDIEISAYGIEMTMLKSSQINYITFYEQAGQSIVKLAKESKLFTITCVAKPVLDVASILDKALKQTCAQDA